MKTNHDLGRVTETHSRTLERLASGDRIVKSADDAAGLSISEKLKGSIRSYQMAQRNSQDGISILQTAEGGMMEAQNMLVRLRELSVQAASDTVGDEERGYTNKEFQHLKQEIQRIANTTVYDGTRLLDGTNKSIDVQIGIDHDAASQLSFATKATNLLPSALGITGADISTKEGARSGLAAIDSAISNVSENRAYLGGLQSELSSHLRNTDIQRSNLSSTNSRIRDADYAEWTAKEANQRIQQETTNAMVAQANVMPQAAIKLLEKA